MQETVSATPLDAVKIEQRPDGQADVWLRKNITKETIEDESSGEQREQWVADEVHLVKAITQEEAEASFDELWDEAEAAETPQDERIKALETIAKTFSAAAPQLAQLRTAATLSIQTMAINLTDEQVISVSSLIPPFEIGKATSKANCSRTTATSIALHRRTHRRSSGSREPGPRACTRRSRSPATASPSGSSRPERTMRTTRETKCITLTNPVPSTHRR